MADADGDAAMEHMDVRQRELIGAGKCIVAARGCTAAFSDGAAATKLAVAVGRRRAAIIRARQSGLRRFQHKCADAAGSSPDDGTTTEHTGFVCACGAPEVRSTNKSFHSRARATRPMKTLGGRELYQPVRDMAIASPSRPNADRVAALQIAVISLDGGGVGRLFHSHPHLRQLNVESSERISCLLLQMSLR